MKKEVRICFLALVLVSAAVSCDSDQDLIGGSENVENIAGENGDEVSGEDGDASAEENDKIEVNDFLIEIDAEGVADVNMLAYCVNMTHIYKYDISGLEDCTWARVRYVQNLNGNDWTPLLTVDPNDTGEERVVKITISHENRLLCEHEIRQK